ncbi:glycoside hydrolase family 3 C-terminal domain-containing protein [Levilactobacillus acidifarinae]|uniref:Beta-glucosidase-related glycosidase n=1 Tax=Levilactobacillus acidifarinae DSM 19394 = JCM 15949 TaxID=1423715 RepID=A0A0R1LPF3_9LACO|nr:glycoside hydrolase family 3 C-terminal domain-containing protein [Levilactobacillus acidifarinae]KRK94090.1 Beta-glucosidase-related glycosidase [Levilactobacillus acidifarinae DSM 19394]GEO69742.1 glycosyl hydrolase [Levilactobacillus acidifarinae]
MDIEKTLAALTLPEKAALVSGKNSWYTAKIDRLGLPALMMTDGPSGLRKQTTATNDLNQSVQAITYPSSALSASSWNTNLLRQLGEHLGIEARAEQVSLLLGPGVNLKRSPLGGRNFEYLAEDPLVAGKLGTAYVQGVQSQHVGVALKHFAANNRENQRFTASSDMSQRTLRELYLKTFEIIVKKALPATVMASYNRINGVLNSQNHYLLRDILRDEWGFHGAVMSDWGAVANHAAALSAGLDLEMPGKGQASIDEIVKAIETGELDEGTLNKSVRHLLHLIQDCQAAPQAKTYDHASHHQFARKLADDSIVLLKNAHDELPLVPAKTGKLVVVGALAKHPRYQGAGSSHVNPTHLVTPLDALADSGLSATYYPGYRLDDDETDEQLADAALAAAKTADHVVVFAGYPAEEESEGFDKIDILLPENQTELIGRLAKINAHTTVVLQNGSVLEMPWIENVAAVVETYLAGEAVGEATWDILTGKVNPSGHLAETFPLQLADTPMAPTFGQDPHHEYYSEGIFMGYRYYDTHEMHVLFPFGHGLSYTTFEYTNLETQADAHGATITFDVTNTGKVAGKSVPQLYVANHASHAPMPTKELRAFTKLAVAPGETQAVTLHLSRQDFSWWRERKHRWQADTGDYEVMIGESSRDIRLQTKLTMNFENAPAPLSLESYLYRVIADPRLKGLFQRIVITPLSQPDVPANFFSELDADGQPLAFHNRMFLNMPLRALIALGTPDKPIKTFIRQANQDR